MWTLRGFVLGIPKELEEAAMVDGSTRLGAFVRILLPLVLEYARGNIQQASHLLGIARQTLRLKLRELGLSVRRSAEVEEDDQT